MAYDSIIIEKQGAVDILTLNRPAALNALDARMVAELDDYLSQLPDNPARVVVLRGAGRSFCAGLDIKNDGGVHGPIPVRAAWRTQTRLGQLYRKMRAAPQPFIGLGHGAACGGGFSLLLACDVRLGAPDLRMNAAYIKIGLGGADMGSTWFLPRLVGASLAAELVLTGRFLHAERALSLGLLSQIVPRDDLLVAGLDMAGEMVAHAPLGLALTKQALHLNMDAPSLEAAMAIEDRQQVMLTQTGDFAEALAAFAEKRPLHHDAS